MSEFFRRLGRAAIALLKRFLANNPNNAYEQATFRMIREIAAVYSRRVIIT